MALAATGNIRGSEGRVQEYFLDHHPFNASIHQAGQAHTRPRAELLAIVVAIELSRWPIHIFSDNLGYVTAVQRLLAGEFTPTMKDNRDLLRRIQRRLRPSQKNIKLFFVGQRSRR